MSDDVICTITSDELEVLKSKFLDYATDSTKIDELNTYKKILAEKYNFAWDRFTVNADGKVRQMQSAP